MPLWTVKNIAIWVNCHDVAPTSLYFSVEAVCTAHAGLHHVLCVSHPPNLSLLCNKMASDVLWGFCESLNMSSCTILTSLPLSVLILQYRDRIIVFMKVLKLKFSLYFGIRWKQPVKMSKALLLSSWDYENDPIWKYYREKSLTVQYRFDLSVDQPHHTIYRMIFHPR